MHEKLFKCSASDDQHGRHAHIIKNKSIKKFLLRKQLTDGLETWYVALSMHVLQRLHNNDPGLNLTHFMAMSNLVKIDNYYYFFFFFFFFFFLGGGGGGDCCSLRPKS